MNRKHIAGLLAGSALLGVGLVIATIPAAEAANTINLSGVIAPTCTIAVTATGAASTLNLATSQTALNVGSALETCNDYQGYTVTIASTNGAAGSASTGILKGLSGNADQIAYTVAYGGSSPGTAVTLANGSGTAETTSAKSPSGGTTNQVFVTYTGNSNLAADTYSDTLTLTIAGK